MADLSTGWEGDEEMPPAKAAGLAVVVEVAERVEREGETPAEEVVQELIVERAEVVVAEVVVEGVRRQVSEGTKTAEARPVVVVAAVVAAGAVVSEVEEEDAPVMTLLREGWHQPLEMWWFDQHRSAFAICSCVY